MSFGEALICRLLHPQTRAVRLRRTALPIFDPLKELPADQRTP